jgi:molecular chaperone GrpE (heat shock protein)
MCKPSPGADVAGASSSGAYRRRSFLHTGSNLTYDEYSQRVAALEAEVAQLRATVHSQAAELEFYRNRTRA